MKLLRVLKQKFNNLIIGLSVRKLSKDLRKEIDSNIDMYTSADAVSILEQETQHKYANGMGNMKRQLRSRLASGANIGNGEDILELARIESDKELSLRQLRESYIVGTKDDKFAEQREKIIDKRIAMYYDLQKKREQRDLGTAIRSAKSSNNTELHKQLVEEWKNKYGKRKN
jgi:hypothetical protein